MKHPVRRALQTIDYAIRPFCYWLAPLLSAVCMYAVAYGAASIQLSEKWQPYFIFFLILAFLFTAFFLLICVPCVLFSGFLSIKTILKKEHYILPAMQLLLNIGMLVCWYFALKEYIL